MPADAVRLEMRWPADQTLSTNSSEDYTMNRTGRTVSQFAGGAGVIAASCAALCCAGAPIILSVLAATGLSFLRTDAILLPIIMVALLIALAGFWAGRRIHRSNGPFMLGVVGSVSLVAGVVFVHGVPAKVLIGAGAILLLVAMLWNARLPHTCEVGSLQGRQSVVDDAR